MADGGIPLSPKPMIRVKGPIRFCGEKRDPLVFTPRRQAPCSSLHSLAIHPVLTGVSPPAAMVSEDCLPMDGGKRICPPPLCRT